MDTGAIKLARDAFAGTDAEFVTWANTPALQSTRAEIPRADFVYYLFSSGLYARMVAAQTNPNAEVAGLAVTALAFLDSPDFAVVKWSDPIMQACLGGFVAAGVFTAGEVETARKSLLETWAAPFPGLDAAGLAEAVLEATRAQRRAELANRYNAAVQVLDAATSIPSIDDLWSAALVAMQTP